MYIQYTIFNKTTGEITQVGGCEEKQLMSRLKHPDTHGLLLGKYDIINWYIDPDTLCPKKKRVMILHIVGTSVAGVPTGSTLRIKELKDAIIVKSGEDVMEVDFPGHYTIIVEHPQWYTSEIKINIE